MNDTAYPDHFIYMCEIGNKLFIIADVYQKLWLGLI